MSKYLIIFALLSQSCGTTTAIKIEIHHYCEHVPDKDRADCIRDSHALAKTILEKMANNNN